MKFSLCIFSIVIYAFISVNNIHGANILVYSPTPAISHFKPYECLFKALARRGHNVTVASKFPPNEKIENYTHLKMDNVFRSTPNYTVLREKTPIGKYKTTYDLVQSFIEPSLQDPVIKYLLRSDSKFDVIMLELYHIDGSFALANHFDAPVIGLSHQPLLPIYNWVIGNPMKFAHIPHLYTSYTNDMNFIQRLLNTFFGFWTIFFYQFVSLAQYQDQGDTFMKLANNYKKLNIEQVSKNISLVLVESHFSVGYPQPTSPNVIEVAGIHLPPSTPLPKDISDFIENSRNGIIYISLGSLVDANSFDDFGKKLVSILQRLPHRVIWKWNPELAPNNSNILIRSWLPQTDILDDPRTKLFISHGGYHSLLEAVNAAVPILCFPFFNDQHHNAAILEKYKFGMKADLDASEDEIFQKIQTLLYDKKYVENVKKQSIIFKDRPMNPLDQAIYWTEYVIRHKGAHHLKPASVYLRWYEYFQLDVICFSISIVVIIFYTVKHFASYLYGLFFAKLGKKIKRS